MTMAPPLPGPQRPDAATPPRRRGSVRRTSTVDTNRPGGLEADAVMDGRARDLLTRADGTAVVTGEASLWARVGGLTRLLNEVRSEPERPALQELIAAMVGPGFRGRVDALVEDDRDRRTPLYLLLDDLPGAALVSGYALLRAGSVGTRHDGYLDAAVDQCSGWAGDAGMMVYIRSEKRSPTPHGPVAPVLESPDDPLSWHGMAPLGPHGMRRRRRLDVAAGDEGAYDVNVFFRDSHVDGAGEETVVHEYEVAVVVDAASRTVRSIEATADVLPWAECPAAVGSAVRLVGRPLADLRPWVRRTFTGTSTCTHLNDTLRGLTDVETLIDQLVAAQV
jgi:hypothetical protein